MERVKRVSSKFVDGSSFVVVVVARLFIIIGHKNVNRDWNEKRKKKIHKIETSID